MRLMTQFTFTQVQHIQYVHVYDVILFFHLVRVNVVIISLLYTAGIQT